MLKLSYYSICAIFITLNVQARDGYSVVLCLSVCLLICLFVCLSCSDFEDTDNKHGRVKLEGKGALAPKTFIAWEAQGAHNIQK